VTSTDASTANGHRGTWIGLVLVLMIACCGAGYLKLRMLDNQQEARQRADAAHALTTYLEQVEAGDYRTAYEQLCSDVLVPDFSESDYEAFLGRQVTYSSFTLGAPTEISGMDGTYKTFPVTLSGGATSMVMV
jgi:Tfp pilus assembly protein PilF